jgi:hypothetical protein
MSCLPSLAPLMLTCANLIVRLPTGELTGYIRITEGAERVSPSRGYIFKEECLKKSPA